MPPILSNHRNETINIQQGDAIHHPQHGIGRVQSIRERSFSGAAASTYAKLYFKRDGLTLMLLEKDLPKTVRRLISRDEAKALLQKFKEWKGTPSEQWKARAEANQAALDSGEPFGYAKVYKELSQMDEQGKLRPRDRTHMKLALDLLTEELARSLGKTPAQAQKLIVEQK